MSRAVESIKEPKFTALDLIGFASFCGVKEDKIKANLRTWITGSDIQSDIPKEEYEKRKKEYKNILTYFEYVKFKKKG